MCRHLFVVLRSIGGRSRRMEHELYRQSDQLTRMEKTMSDLLAKLEALKAQVNDYTTNQGNRLAEAVAAARAAQQKEDKAASDAELADALSKIDEIGKGLVTFTPSGN
jgi:predicted  nucleic acid-binding Zn-ribbon protein